MAYKSGLSEDDLVRLTGDEDKASKISKIFDDIYDYSHFRSLVDLGFTVHHSEFDFDKIMVFSWIKEGIESGRKDRVSNIGKQG